MKKKILLVINPESGKKKHQFYNKLIKSHLPFCEFVTFESKFKENIFDFVKENIKFIKEMDLIYIIGGDGMFHLTLNAFYENDIDKPFMVFPAGTGNGIYKSILHSYGEEYTLKEYINLLVNDDHKLMDIMDVTNGEDDLILKSVLGISWGIISDIDMNTEWMRMIGSLRLEIGAVYYLLRKYSYSGELSYKDGKGGIVVHKGNFLHFWANNTSHGSQITHSSPGAKFDDGYIHISFMMMPVSRYELFQMLWNIDSGKFIELPKVEYIKTSEFSLKTDNGKIVIDGELSNYKNIDCKISEEKVKIIR
jgi:sphingosine kinase